MCKLGLGIGEISQGAGIPRVILKVLPGSQCGSRRSSLIHLVQNTVAKLLGSEIGGSKEGA